jgi:CRISPR system Cascade subunit CasB
MSERSIYPQVAAFCERLGRLNPGDRARLKRSAGKTLAESGHNALGLFYSILPGGVSPYQEDAYFLVATLYPLADLGKSGDFGAALRRARQDKYAGGLDRRVKILLDADERQLPFRLRQAVHFLRAQRVPVNWPLLLQDLLAWGHPERFVQRQWARSYFAG